LYIKLITVGKIKESYYRDAVAEYEKRMKRYGKFSILEVEDEGHRIMLLLHKKNRLRKKKRKEF